MVESRRATLHQIESQLQGQEERQQELQTQQKSTALAEATTAAERLAQEMARLDAELQPLQVQQVKMEQELSGREDNLAALQETAHEDSGHGVAILQRRTSASTAQYLGLVTASDVLEDQRFAGAERSSNQVQDEFGHPGSLATTGLHSAAPCRER